MEDRMYRLLDEALGNGMEAMVPVDALVDIAGQDWLPAASEAALRLDARVERPERASAFALVTRK
jgi:hypothetical protein